MVFTSDEFIFENLDSQKAKLADFLVNYFKGRVQVKIILEAENQTGNGLSLSDIQNMDGKLANKENSFGTSNVNVSEKIDLDSKSTLEQKIINLFGAEDITSRIDGN